MKILCINVRKGIGDQIIFLPFIHAISRKFKIPVSLLAKENSKAKELFSEDDFIDEVINLEKNMDGIKGVIRLAKEIRRRNFDKIFIFNSSLRYNVIARLAGIKSIYQYPLFLKKDNIIHSAKIFTESIIDKVVVTEPYLKIKKENLDLDKDLKHICLGISASGPTKRWDIKNYIRLANEISKNTRCKFYVAGGEKDIDLINEFKNFVKEKNILSFEEMTIKQTSNYISNCDLYVGNDTGWAHLSIALNVKALTIFCDSPIAAYGSYSSKMSTVEPEGIEKGTTKHNTLGKKNISFEKVLKKSIEMLN